MTERMSTKEKIVKKSIRQVQCEISKIDEILNATPVSDIIELHRKTTDEVKILNNENRYQEALEVLEHAKKEEAKLNKIFEKQRDTVALIDRKVELYFELSDLNNELWLI